MRMCLCITTSSIRDTTLMLVLRRDSRVLCAGSAARAPCPWISSPAPLLPPAHRGLWDMFLCTPGWVGQGFLEFTTDPEQVSCLWGDPGTPLRSWNKKRLSPPSATAVFPFTCVGDTHRGPRDWVNVTAGRNDRRKR